MTAIEKTPAAEDYKNMTEVEPSMTSVLSGIMPQFAMGQSMYWTKYPREIFPRGPMHRALMFHFLNPNGYANSMDFKEAGRVAAVSASIRKHFANGRIASYHFADGEDGGNPFWIFTQFDGRPGRSSKALYTIICRPTDMPAHM